MAMRFRHFKNYRSISSVCVHCMCACVLVYEYMCAYHMCPNNYDNNIERVKILPIESIDVVRRKAQKIKGVIVAD